MSQRKFIEVEIPRSSIEPYEFFNGKSLYEVVESIEEMRTSFIGCDIRFRVESYGHEGAVEIGLVERRLETDEEYESRVKQEKREAERLTLKQKKIDAEERKEYERLKKKFGKETK